MCSTVQSNTVLLRSSSQEVRCAAVIRLHCIKLDWTPWTAHCLLQTTHCTTSTLHTTHCILTTSHCKLHTAHCILRTSHCTQQTAQGTLHTGYCILQIAHRKVHTAQCTLHNSRRTLHTNWSSHLGIHKQTIACWSIPRSQTVYYHFKICRRSAESGNYEAFVLVDCWQLQHIKPQILTNHHDITITTSSSINFQLHLAALQKNTPRSVLLGKKQMPCIVLLS